MTSRGVWATFCFEGKRSLMISRWIWWLALSLVPFALAVLLRSQEPGILRTQGEVGIYPYIFVIRVLCPLALLLWATPAVHAEIEGKTWAYVAVRPGGKGSLLIGKYLVALVWASVIGIAAVSVCVVYLRPDDLFRVWWLLVKLVLLSSMAYGAIYLLLGVLFLKRAMVFAVIYTLIAEVALTLVPAVVNEVTVDFRLRTLLIKGLVVDNSIGRGFVSLISEGGPAQQVLILVLYALALLVAALLVLRQRQLVVAEE